MPCRPSRVRDDSPGPRGVRRVVGITRRAPDASRPGTGTECGPTPSSGWSSTGRSSTSAAPSKPLGPTYATRTSGGHEDAYPARAPGGPTSSSPKTFFNSASRRIFHTVASTVRRSSSRPRFVALSPIRAGSSRRPTPGAEPRAALGDSSGGHPFPSGGGSCADAGLATEKLDAYLTELWGRPASTPPRSCAASFQEQGANLAGPAPPRARRRNGPSLALVNPAARSRGRRPRRRGEASIVFSFTARISPWMQGTGPSWRSLKTIIRRSGRELYTGVRLPTSTGRPSSYREPARHSPGRTTNSSSRRGRRGW